MAGNVTYTISAVDKISAVYRRALKLNGQTDRGVNKLNATLKKTQRGGASSIGRLAGSFRKMERRVLRTPGRIVNRFKREFNKLGPVGKTVAGLFTFASIEQGVSAVRNFAINSIHAASDFEEAKSKAKQLFGDGFADIERFSKSAAKNLGLTKTQAFDAASSFAALFENAGVGSGQVAEMSKGAVRLASDLASFNNLDTTEALEAAAQVLKGETSPALTKFNIVMDEAMIKQEAYSKGLIKTTKGVLPKSIKTQAIYSLALRQTIKAQGDFARTSDGFANRQKIMAARWGNISIMMGQVFMPYALKVQDWAFNALGWIEKNNKKIKSWGQSVERVAKQFYHFGQRGFAWLKENKSNIKTVGKLLLGLYGIVKITTGVGAIVTFTRAWKELGFIGTLLGSKFKFLKSLGIVLPFIKTGVVAVMSAFKGLFAVLAFNPLTWIVSAIAGVAYLLWNWKKVKGWLAKFSVWLFKNNPFGKKFTMAIFTNVISPIMKIGDLVDKYLIQPVKNWLGIASEDITPKVKPYLFGQPDYDFASGLGIKNARPGVDAPGLLTPIAQSSDDNKSEGSKGGLLTMGQSDKKVQGSTPPPTKTETATKPMAQKMDGLVQGAKGEIKNFNIKIENLVKALNVNTSTVGMSIGQIESEIKRVLLSAVNDVNQMS